MPLGMPQNGVSSLRIAHIALSLFFCTKGIFSDSPEGFALLLGQCAALRSLAQLTTPFLASGNAPKWGFIPKDRTYRAFFVLLHKRNFFRMVPEGLNAFGSFVHAAESAS